MKAWATIGFLLCFAFAKAQENETKLDFSLLRQNDQIAIPSKSENFYKSLKQIRLSENNTLSFGGSYRFQTEGFINEQFSAEEDQNDLWFLHRFQLHAHLKISNKFELFTEVNSSLINSKTELSPVDKDELNVNQFFARYNFNSKWSILAGRQNMRLGSGRLIDIREGPNVRLSFDMAQLNFKVDNTNIAGFFAIPVSQNEGVFDNDFLDFDEYVSALYWTQNWKENSSTDSYILNKYEENKMWNTGTATDNRTSIGLRHFGSWNNLTYDNEFVYQLGSFGDRNISAWTASFNIKHRFPLFGEVGIIGIKAEAISGDGDGTDNTLNTFDALYPRGAYFGRVARFGPSNLLDIHPYVETEFGKLSLAMDYVAFWRFSKEDGIYGPPLNLEYPVTNNERFIGHQIGTITAYKINDFISIELETNLIFPGNFLAESNLGDTLLHTVLTTEIKF